MGWPWTGGPGWGWEVPPARGDREASGYGSQKAPHRLSLAPGIPAGLALGELGWHRDTQAGSHRGCPRGAGKAPHHVPIPEPHSSTGRWGRKQWLALEAGGGRALAPWLGQRDRQGGQQTCWSPPKCPRQPGSEWGTPGIWGWDTAGDGDSGAPAPWPWCPQLLPRPAPPSVGQHPKNCTRLQNCAAECSEGWGRPSGSPRPPPPCWAPGGNGISPLSQPLPGRTHSLLLPGHAHAPSCDPVPSAGGDTRVLLPPLGKPVGKGREQKRAPLPGGAFGRGEDVRCAEGGAGRGCPAPEKRGGAAWRSVAQRGSPSLPLPSPLPLR